ncbi:MAG TPA: polysaccharide biosynthesis/export family protein [Haliangiales bacterium]|nr:polysaccharide biosynthesis/export family protein [Haliangiales bacterium]
MRLRALALWMAVAGCADAAGGPYPTSGPPPAADSAVGPGDVFDVRVYGEAALTAAYEVAVDGTINFPLIGVVEVAGKTPPQIEREIETRLADGYIKRPSVSVRVTDYRSRRVSVFGQVRSPGTFPYTENMSIVEVISRAGGFTAMAKKNSVRVTRGTGATTERIEVAVEEIGQGKAPNFLLRPGDVVFVPERVF